MGHIKEPKGIDFVIASDPLTDKARQEISEYIRNYKNRTADKKTKPATNTKQQKAVHAYLRPACGNSAHIRHKSGLLAN